MSGILLDDDNEITEVTNALKVCCVLGSFYQQLECTRTATATWLCRHFRRI